MQSYTIPSQLAIRPRYCLNFGADLAYLAFKTDANFACIEVETQVIRIHDSLTSDKRKQDDPNG